MVCGCVLKKACQVGVVKPIIDGFVCIICLLREKQPQWDLE